MGAHSPTNAQQGLIPKAHYIRGNYPGTSLAYGSEHFVINISSDPSQWSTLQQELADIPNGLTRVLVRSVNKVARSANTKIVREIASYINITQRELRDRNVKLTQANYDNIEARISIAGRRIPLRRFGANQTRRGVSYAIRRGSRTVLFHAFLAAMTSGHVGVFIRTGDPSIGRRLRRRGQGRGMAGLVRPRLPITERFGPSVPAAMENVETLSRTTLGNEISSNLYKEVNTQAQLVIEGKSNQT